MDGSWRGGFREVVGKVLRFRLPEGDFGDEGVGLRGGGFGGSGGRDEFGASSRGECGGKNDHGRADLEKVFDEAVDQGRSVGVVRVDFIDDDNLPGEGEEAKGGEAGGQDGEKGLVNGAGPEGSEELAARGGKPTERFIGIVVIQLGILEGVFQLRGKGANIPVMQPGIAVDQSLDGIGIGGLGEKVMDPGVDFLRSELGGKSEIEAAVVALVPKLVGSGQSRFRFPQPHRCFDDVEAGGVCGFNESGLEWPGLKLSGVGGIEKPAKSELPFNAGEEAKVLEDFPGFAGDLAGVNSPIPSRRKPVGVGADPIGENGQSREEVDAVLVELGRGLGGERAKGGDEEIEKFVAEGEEVRVFAFV